MTTVPMQRKSGGGLVRLVFVLLLVLAVGAGVTAIIAPWGFYMGGRFHMIPQWQGWGRIHSNSAGGDYALFVWFWPKPGRFRGLTHVSGNAVLCTPRGEKFNLALGGDFEKPAGVDTNGKKAGFYMNNRSFRREVLGGDSRPELELRGRWSNPDLALDDHGSIARNFGPDAKLYRSIAKRPYMGEVSAVTLHEGGKSDFEAACAAVKKAP